MSAEGAIAVVGLACRFPGADSAGSFWTALRDGQEGISHFTPAELIAAGVNLGLVRHPDYVPARGVLAGSRRFDWSFFGYSRAEAATIDPQQRIFLECAAHAIDDAGLDPSRFPGWIGVYAGADGISADPVAAAELDPLVRVIGQRQDFLTTRVAYKLGLRGPAITVQTACSTSLTAVHLAVQSLVTNECDLALAGGVSLAPPGEWGYLYADGGILSPDGHCRPFDERAAGTVPSEGVGVVVLERVEDAVRAGHRIAAVIRGSAVNNDGDGKVGYTAPSVPGQRDAIRLAQKVADVDPVDIDYVEAHGTATRLGDPVELQALADAFGPRPQSAPGCLIGAVKSNIGHAGAAAGVAGLIKAVLMLEHRELVPTLHYRSPNPLLNIEATPFAVCAQRGPWPGGPVPLAAVSSFGVGGTNAHVVVEGPPQRPPRPRRTSASVLAVSATSPATLGRMCTDLAGQLRSSGGAGLADVAVTLASRRQFDARLAIVAAEPTEAARLLQLAASKVSAPAQAASAVAPAGLDAVAFLFPGQGTLRHAAGAGAYRLLSGFRSYFDEISSVTASKHQLDLTPVVAGQAEPAWFADTVHQQLGLLALGYALGRQLADWGVAATAMLGNSVGEYVAALLAGVWTLPDAVDLVQARAQAMRATEPGQMIAVEATAAQVAALLPAGSGVAIAVAGPGRAVLSGPDAAIGELLAGGALDGLALRTLETTRAFHSAAMEPAAQTVREAVAAVPSSSPAVRLASNASGQWADPDAIGSPDYWARQLRGTVLLDDAMATLLSAGCDTFLELGPGSSMIGGLRRHHDWNPQCATIAMLGRAGDDAELCLLRAIGSLWERGADLDPGQLGLDADRPLLCSLPGLPFESADPALDGVPAAGRPAGGRSGRQDPGQARPVAGHDAGPTLELLWCQALGVPSAAGDDDFFALGGESLMAVSLISAVRDQLGSDVSVADFTAVPSFGRLAELVDQGARGTRHPDAGQASVLVPLRADGDQRPIFLVADALGSATSYQVLAGHLAGQPVYGLEPTTGHRDRRDRADRTGRPAGVRSARIEDLAAGHVGALLGAQPSGPYTIGGWSFGAVVAHELARQLIDRGHQVDLLIFLDGAPPAAVGRPAGMSPAFLTMVLRLQVCAALGIGAIGSQLRRAPALRHRFIVSLGSLLRYRPRPVGCQAVLFEAGVDHSEVTARERRLAPLYGGGLRVFPANGDHWSMLADPHASGLAGKLSDLLHERAALLDEAGNR